jgi:hypothetical protein
VGIQCRKKVCAKNIIAELTSQKRTIQKTKKGKKEEKNSVTKPMMKGPLNTLTLTDRMVQFKALSETNIQVILNIIIAHTIK